MNIAGKTIIVTGASDGIGRELALALARRGANIALVARSTDKLAKVLAELVSLGSAGSKAYPCDLQNPQALKSTAGEIIQDHPTQLIGLVNNAGIWQKKADLENIKDEEIQNVIEIDLLSVIRFTKELLPTLKSLPESAIINVSSRSGVTAQPGQSVYTAAKWGLKGFTEVLKEDLKDTSVHVSGIYQGGTNTAMFNKAGETLPPDKLASFIPASELAELIAHLLSLPKQIWIPELHVSNK